MPPSRPHVLILFGLGTLPGVVALRKAPGGRRRVVLGGRDRARSGSARLRSARVGIAKPADQDLGLALLRAGLGIDRVVGPAHRRSTTGARSEPHVDARLAASRAHGTAPHKVAPTGARALVEGQPRGSFLCLILDSRAAYPRRDADRDLAGARRGPRQLFLRVDDESGGSVAGGKLQYNPSGK